jgi:hypothetical protein
LKHLFTQRRIKARIELESTTSDVISIRARWEDRQIHYRVVDEYDTEFDCKPDRSDGPLSLDEFIRFIDAISCQYLSGPFSLAYNQLTGRGSRTSRRAWLGWRWWRSKKCVKGLVVQPFYRQLVNAPQLRQMGGPQLPGDASDALVPKPLN